MTNSIVIFKNNKKIMPGHPDVCGTIKVNEREYYVSFWQFKAETPSWSGRLSSKDKNEKLDSIKCYINKTQDGYLITIIGLKTYTGKFKGYIAENGTKYMRAELSEQKHSKEIEWALEE